MQGLRAWIGGVAGRKGENWRSESSGDDLYDLEFVSLPKVAINCSGAHAANTTSSDDSPMIECWLLTAGKEFYFQD